MLIACQTSKTRSHKHEAIDELLDSFNSRFTSISFPSLFVKKSANISLVKLMYFSSLFGMQDMFPSLTLRFFINRYYRTQTGCGIKQEKVFGNLYLRLHSLCAAPLNFPVR